MQLRLVGQKCTKLEETPIAMSSTLLLANCYPFADARQIFDGDTARGVFSNPDNTLGNHVVRVFLESLLSARQLAQAAFGAFRANVLQDVTALLMPLATGFNLCAAEGLPIATRRNVHDAQVNSYPTIRLALFWLSHITDLMQVKPAVAVNQIRLTAQGAKHLLLARATDKRNLQSPADCPDGDNAFVCVPCKDTGIIADAALRSKQPFRPLVFAVGVGHLANRMERNLSRKPKSLPYIAVGEFLQTDAAKVPVLPSLFTDVITGCIHLLHRVQQGIGLFGRRSQLHLGNEFHGLSIAHSSNMCKSARFSSPQLKLGESETEVSVEYKQYHPHYISGKVA